MTPREFIEKWKRVALSERATAQEHFLDLCHLFEHPTPAEDDPAGERFTFEKGLTKTGGGIGFADVWKKGFFAWEYKKRKRNLDEAMEQLTRYAAMLENPPLHVACDTHIFRIETRWTNEVPAKYEFDIEDLDAPENLARLRAVFFEPEKLRSGATRAKLTRDAADKFQKLSDSLQLRHPERDAVAHFVNQLVFCFFADSVGLLPRGFWKKLLLTAERRPERAKTHLDRLFADMQNGGEFDLEDIPFFNGGLFDGRPALSLTHVEIGILLDATRFEWSLIDPTIFGTLFERFLDPDKRAQIGAHYTDPDKIMLIIEPVILRPLRAEWERAKAEIAAIMAPVSGAATSFGPTAARERGKKFAAAVVKAEARRDVFIDRLCALRILDPACGSGNFLYIALQGVKDIEWRAVLDCEAMGLHRALPRVGPEILHGIEINPFAAELARTTIWIGDIQWRVRNAVMQHPRPILRKLDAIECRDALLTPDGKGGFVEAPWPDVDFIVGNPPFLGGKLLRNGLGDAYVETLFRVYAGVVPAEADLVCYWFAKAWRAIEAKRAGSVGLVATNSIRGGANRRVLEPIAATKAIFEAWSDEAWTVDGAAVRVSLVCFGGATLSGRSPQPDEPATARDSKDKGALGARLDGKAVEAIHADLNANGSDLTSVCRLSANAGVAFMGVTKSGPFDIAGQLARKLACEPINPNGRPNSDVLRRSINGRELTGRFGDRWLLDFERFENESQLALYEAPFRLATESIRPERQSSKTAKNRKLWWRYERPRPEMYRALATCRRYIATSMVAKHRCFEFVDRRIVPENLIIAIARDDDTTFGILHSRFHEAWSLRLGTWLGVGNDPRYTPTTTFETFPFPEGLTPNIPAAEYAADPRAQRIAAAAKKLDHLRRNWLNPADLVDIVPEITPTAAPGEAPVRYPDRIMPKTAEAAKKLKERTLTNLYNERPRWLADAHADLDRAVAAAYGWPEDISTEDALAKLLALNLARSGAKPE